MPAAAYPRTHPLISGSHDPPRQRSLAPPLRPLERRHALDDVALKLRQTIKRARQATGQDVDGAPSSDGGSSGRWVILAKRFGVGMEIPCRVGGILLLVLVVPLSPLFGAAFSSWRKRTARPARRQGLWTISSSRWARSGGRGENRSADPRCDTADLCLAQQVKELTARVEALEARGGK